MYLFKVFAHSIRSNLRAIAIEVSLQLTQRVTTKLLSYQARHGGRDPRPRRYTGCWHNTDIAALIRCLHGLAGLEADAGEGPAQGGDGLEIAAHDDVFAVGDTAFDAAGVVLLARDLGEGFVGALVADRIVDSRPEGCGGGDSAAQFDSLDGLKAHDGLREEAVQSLVPVGMSADARRKAVDDDLEDSADGVAGAKDSIDLGLHGGFALGVYAVEEDLLLGLKPCDLAPLGRTLQLGLADADDVAGNLDAEGAGEKLRDGAGGYPGCALAGPAAREGG